jgi:hypothetical protein
MSETDTPAAQAPAGPTPAAIADIEEALKDSSTASASPTTTS